MKKKTTNILMLLVICIGLVFGALTLIGISEKQVTQIDGMVAVEGLNGKSGYITAKDHDSPYTPQGIIVPVYDKDCKTVIDSFKIGGYNPEEPVIAYSWGPEIGLMLFYKDQYISIDAFAEIAQSDGLKQDYVNSVLQNAQEYLIRAETNYVNHK